MRLPENWNHQVLETRLKDSKNYLKAWGYRYPVWRINKEHAGKFLDRYSQNKTLSYCRLKKVLHSARWVRKLMQDNGIESTIRQKLIILSTQKRSSSMISTTQGRRDCQRLCRSRNAGRNFSSMVKHTQGQVNRKVTGQRDKWRLPGHMKLKTVKGMQDCFCIEIFKSNTESDQGKHIKSVYIWVISYKQQDLKYASNTQPTGE